MKNTNTVTTHHLSELTERVTRDMRRAAMEEYLLGDLHKTMLLAGALVEQCHASTELLRKGKIEAHLDICCCADTFTSILSAPPLIHYMGCDLPEEDSPIDDKTFAKLNRLPAAILRKRLISNYGCQPAEYAQTHQEDRIKQFNYYKGVLERFTFAARYAMAIGSESVRLWLEAFCLLQPRPEIAADVRIRVPPDIDPECVPKAYEVAQRAQRMLWVDATIIKYPSAKLAQEKNGKKEQ